MQTLEHEPPVVGEPAPRHDAPPVQTPDDEISQGERSEAILDAMLAESFPASDPPQLDSAMATKPEQGPARSDPTETNVSTGGSSAPAVVAGAVEETLALGERGSITLRLIGQPVRLQILLGPNGLSLDQDDVDMLVSSLASQREAMSQSPPAAVPGN